MLIAFCAMLPASWSCVFRNDQAGVKSLVTVPKTFSLSGKGRLPDRWWMVLDDKQLDKLIGGALESNLDLMTTWDRLDEALAVARQSSAGLYPTLDGDGSASRTRTETHKGVNAGATPFGHVYTSSFGLGLVAAYEVDLWGRVRSTSEAGAMDLVASGEDLDAAAISLTAEVAQTWYRLLEKRDQVKLLDSQIETSRQVLELVTLRFGQGKVSAVDVLQQRQQVESKLAEKAQAESDRKVLSHQLAVLLGKSPKALAPEDGKLLASLPPVPKTGLPADLVRRRPDVRAAHFRLQAANHRVAAAIADRFPRVGLSAQVGSNTSKVRDLFDNWFATLAANLAAPILDGGLRQAEVDRTRAVASRHLHAYAQKILTSLREVEDALAREAQQRLYLASLVRQLDLSEKVIARTRQQYANGAIDYLRVLDALESHQRLQRTHLLARRQLIGFRINLYRALGGSWPLEDKRPVPGDAAGEKDPPEVPE